jgi:hypothetical protein
MTGWYPLCQTTQKLTVHAGSAFETASDTVPVYEINLCGWAGRRTAVREGSEAASPGGINQEVEADTPGMLSADDYRQFWASAALLAILTPRNSSWGPRNICIGILIIRPACSKQLGARNPMENIS